MKTEQTLTVPVADIGRAVDYYAQLLGSTPRWSRRTQAVFEVESEDLEVRLVEAPETTVVAALDDGSLQAALAVIWRITGGWTVTPGGGAACCVTCASLPADSPHADHTHDRVEARASRESRWRTPSATEATRWNALADSANVAPAAVAVLQSAARRRLPVSRTIPTADGIRVSFAGDDLPDVELLGASQSPTRGSMLQVPFLGKDIVGLPFKQWGRRRRTIVTCDRVGLA